MHPVAREFLGDLDAPSVSFERIRLIAIVRLVLGVPLVYVPTALGLWGNLPQSTSAVAAAEVWAWTASALLFAAVNGLILALARGPTPRPQTIRLTLALTYASIAVEVVGNQISTHAAGLTVSMGALYLVLLVAIYRVMSDYRTSLFCAGLGVVLIACTGMAELAGLIPQAPLLPAGTDPLPLDAPTRIVLLSNIIVGVGVAFTAINYGMNQTVKLHQYITNAVLRRYLPPSLVERASRGAWILDAAPERRVVTVMFIDIVGFSSLSERLGADRVGRILNHFLSKVADLAHEHGATVDKFVGDAVMIVFGAPDPLPPEQQARRCVALAREIQRRLPGWSLDEPIRVRAGINTGEAVVGNFGSSTRSDYTVVGPAINVAARLETAAPPGGVLVSEETARLLGADEPLEPAAELKLRGISEPVLAHRLAPVREAASDLPSERSA